VTIGYDLVRGKTIEPRKLLDWRGISSIYFNLCEA